MIGILILLIILLDFFISLWNAYVSGYNSVALQKYEGKFKDLFSITNSFGVVIAFAGSTYVLAFFLSWLLSSLGYISPKVAELIAVYNYLVFGGLIAFSGIAITIQSIVIAYMRRNFGSILVSIWNIISSAWNIYTYTSSFRYAVEMAKNLGSDEEDRNNAILILIAAALISIFLTYTFYKMGKRKAEREIGNLQ